MQSESPKIYVLYDEVSDTIKSILRCYIKDGILNQKNLSEIDYRNPRNFEIIDNIYFGAVISTSNASQATLTEVKIKCLHFYIESVK